jgi:AcrR family transcriptional regulator
MLFAQRGYEQTSTAAIAREAGSSESQLIRYFGGKAGLLEAIFNESWIPLNENVQQHIDEASHSREAIIRIMSMLLQALSRDQATAFLFLFEGRRTRGSTYEVLLSKGFGEFMSVIEKLIERGRDDGSFRKDIEPRVLSAAMVGCAEGLLRDKVLANRNHEPDIYDEDSIIRAFSAMVDGLAP